MACQEALWSRAVAADATTPDEANSSAAAPSEARREEFVQEFTAEAPVRLQSQQATLDALSGERSRQYKVMCEGLRVASKEDSKQGALMHVAVEGAQARLIVLGSDPNHTQAAMDFIARVDPPSEGVPMRQVSADSCQAYRLTQQWSLTQQPWIMDRSAQCMVLCDTVIALLSVPCYRIEAIM